LKVATLGLAVNMSLNGVSDSLGIMIPFGIITLLDLLIPGVLLESVRSF
jgi:hypothetical protein